jgi:hypothetical protein
MGKAVQTIESAFCEVLDFSVCEFGELVRQNLADVTDPSIVIVVVRPVPLKISFVFMASPVSVEIIGG